MNGKHKIIDNSGKKFTQMENKGYRADILEYGLIKHYIYVHKQDYGSRYHINYRTKVLRKLMGLEK